MSVRGIGMAPREAYTILSSTLDPLGTIEWYGRWRQYIFEPEIGAVFSADCLRDLAGFVEKVNKNAKHEEPTT
jgi:hypothetical protein